MTMLTIRLAKVRVRALMSKAQKRKFDDAGELQDVLEGFVQVSTPNGT